MLSPNEQYSVSMSVATWTRVCISHFSLNAFLHCVTIHVTLFLNSLSDITHRLGYKPQLIYYQ